MTVSTDLWAAANDRQRLTPQEARAAFLVAAGRSNKEIGQALCISEGAAANLVRSGLLRLDARNRVELAVVSLLSGQIPIDALCADLARRRGVWLVAEEGTTDDC